MAKGHNAGVGGSVVERPTLRLRMRPSVRGKAKRNGQSTQVYFIKHGKRIKIGVSRNPRERLKDIAIHLDKPPKLLGSIEGSYQLEKHIHAVLSNFRIGGEWFLDCADVRDVMNKVLVGDKLGFKQPEPKKFVPVEKQRTYEEFVELWNFVAKMMWPENHPDKFAEETEIPLEDSRAYFSGQKKMPRVVSMALGALLSQFLVKDAEENRARREGRSN